VSNYKNLKKKYTKLVKCFFRKRIPFNRTGNWKTQNLDTINQGSISKHRDKKRTQKNYKESGSTPSRIEDKEE
jgi:hypothetical protein